MNYIYNLLPFLSHDTIDNLLIIFLIIFLIYIFNYILKDGIRKYLKIYLYKHRTHPFFRLAFNRYDYLLKPIRLAINLLFIKLLINIFILSSTINNLFSLIYSLIFIWFTYEIIKFLLYSILIRKIHKAKNTRKELFNLFLNITKIIIVIIVIVVLLANIGIDVTALITSLGIGGAILALSAKDTLTNFFDSLRLISSDAFRQGDWIQTKDVDGFVTEVGLITTKIRTFSNAFVTVPNSKLANNYIHNWSRRVVGRKIKFHIRLKIQNDANEVDRVIQDILKMLNNHHDIVNDKKIANFTKDYQEKIITLRKKLQKIFFVAQINLAKKYDLPVIIHNRETSEDILEILKETNYKNFIFHCYSENLDYAKKLLEFAPKCKISFSGIVTFKNAKEIQETVKNIPLESILIETDAPYLTPHPFRGTRNEPYYTTHVCKKLAQIFEILEKDVAMFTTKNANNVFFSVKVTS